MNAEKYDELETRASLPARLDSIRQLEARARVAQEIEAMKAEGKALELSDEEIKVLHAFRRFKLRMTKDGQVFTWQTRKPEGVEVVEETALISHPNEVG